MDLESASKLTTATQKRLLALPRLLMQVRGCMSLADGLLTCLAGGLTMLLLHGVTALAALYKCVLCKGGRGVSSEVDWEAAPGLW